MVGAFPLIVPGLRIMSRPARTRGAEVTPVRKVACFGARGPVARMLAPIATRPRGPFAPRCNMARPRLDRVRPRPDREVAADGAAPNSRRSCGDLPVDPLEPSGPLHERQRVGRPRPLSARGATSRFAHAFRRRFATRGVARARDSIASARRRDLAAQYRRDRRRSRPSAGGIVLEPVRKAERRAAASSDAGPRGGRPA